MDNAGFQTSSQEDQEDLVLTDKYGEYNWSGKNYMQIEKIDNFETFKKIRENWDSVYAGDHQAQFFLSWIWLSGWLQMVHEPWFILAAKPDTKDSSYVAFFPLKNINPPGWRRI